MRIHPLLSLPLSLAFGASVHASSYSLSLSADTTRFDYAETENGRLLDTETNDFGDMTGFTVSLEPAYQGFYLTASYSRGDTDYIGGTNITPIYGSHVTTTDNTVIDYSAGFKSITPLDRLGEVEMPFKIGIGYREWQRDIRGTPTVSGLEEIYDWGYFDIGIGLHVAIAPNASLGIDTSYQKAFNAQMRENMFGYTFNLNNVYGYKIAVPLEIALDETLTFFFQYNYEYWNIDASNMIGGYYEPDSETKNQTLSAGVEFWF